MRKTIFFVAATSAATFAMGAFATDARAANTKAECVSSAEEGQSLRDDGKLRAAREKFVTCSRPECPGAVTKECTGWLDAVDARLPTVIVSAVDAAGNDLVDVKVTVDGQPFLEKLTGQAQPMDPGPHKFHYEYKDEPPIDETVVVKEREKGRTLQAKFKGDAVASSGASSGGTSSSGSTSGGKGKGGGIPAAAWIAGGVGIIALGSFAFFGLTGYSDYNDLKSRCSPDCSKDDTDSLKTKLLIADVSLGVAIVGLGVATVLIITKPKDDGTVNASTSIGFAPTRGGGGMGALVHRF